MDLGNNFEISVIVPAFNEGAVIRSVIIPLVSSGYNVVLVDDGSTDNTKQVIQGLPIYYLHHCTNLGQGAALQTGKEFALANLPSRYLVTFDSDGQHDSREIVKLIDPLVKGKADVALGSRFLSKPSAATMPNVRRFLLIMATIFTRITSGLKLTDTHNGLRAFTRKAAEKIQITQNGMSHASQILHQISVHHLRYMEVPVCIEYTNYSLGKGQRMSNLINILWEMIFGE